MHRPRAVRATCALLLLKLSVSCAEPPVESDAQHVSDSDSIPSFVDVGEAACRDGRGRKIDWSSGIHDGCCQGSYCSYGRHTSACPAGSEYVVVYGADRCMERVEPVFYTAAGVPRCPSHASRWTDIVNGIADRCCIDTGSGWRCDDAPQCDQSVLFATRGDDVCLSREDTGELSHLADAACPDDRPSVRIDLRHPTVDHCCNDAGCAPLVAVASCPDDSFAVSLIGLDACMRDASTGTE